MKPISQWVLRSFSVSILALVIFAAPRTSFSQPVITQQPTNTAVVAGQNAYFSVMATGSAPLSYHWRFKGVPFAATNATLTLSNVSDSMAGAYTVVVANGGGSVTSSPAILTVLHPPNIVSQPVNEVVTNGDEASFSVGANGQNLNYQWLSNGIPLAGQTESILEIYPVVPADAAGYSVIVSNTDGSVTSSVALLTVVQQQLVTSQAITAPIDTCTNITFSVVTYGTDVPLSYQWYENGTLVGTNSSYTKTDVQSSDAGSYSVNVSDAAGASATTSAGITVTDPPPVVITKNVTIQLDATGHGNILPAQINNGSYDNCGIIALSVSPSNFDCGNVGTNLVTLSVTDTSNQVSTATALVTVQDVTPPTIVFNSIIVQLDNTGSHTLTQAEMSQIASNSQDACGIAAIQVSPSYFGYCNLGTNLVTLTVTDVNSNSTSTNGYIVVQRPSGPPAIVYVDPGYTNACPAVGFPYNGGSGTNYVNYNAFPTIQAGLNAVASNGVVEVAPGTYPESPKINAPVTLESLDGAAVTTIALHTNGPEYLGAIEVAAPNVSFIGFSVTGFDSVTNANEGLASTLIYLDQGISNILVVSNIFSVGNINANTDININDYDDGYALLSVYDESTNPYSLNNLSVLYNTFQSVDAGQPGDTGPGAAFFLNTGAGNFTFVSNTITGLATPYTQAAQSLIADNVVTGTGPTSGTGGFGVWGYPDPTVWGHATITDNVITNTGTAITLYDSENVIIAQNELDGNGEGVFDGDTGSVTYTQGGTIQVVSNSLSNELLAGLDNETGTGTPSAASNWWGSISGPYSPTLNPYGTGSALSNAVAFIPWLGSGTNTQTNLIGFYPPGTPLEYPPVQLVYVTQPGGANLNAPLFPQPVVTVEDTNGVVTPWANPIISAALTNDTTGALLSGTTNAASSNAVATFANLTVTYAGGTNLELVVSAPYLASAISTPFNITNPVPTIASVSPYYALAGSSNFTLVVTGSNFVPDSVVYWNGTPLATTFVNSTELTAVVPSSLTAQTNVVTITVLDPGPGGGTTPTSIPFDVDADQPQTVYVDHNYAGLASNTLVSFPYSTNGGPYIIDYNAFPTIQTGLNAVASNGVVEVAPGTYPESPKINAPVTLESLDGAAVTTIALHTNGPEYLGAIEVAAPNVSFVGFSVTGFDSVTNANEGLASTLIYLDQGISNILVVSNIFSVGNINANTDININDYDDGYALLSVYDESTNPYSLNNLSVLYNTFQSVDAGQPGDTGPGAAFFLNTGAGNFTFISNTITGLATPYTQAAQSLIADNVVTGTGPTSGTGGFGVWGYPDPTVWGHATITDNIITNTGTAITLYDSENVIIAQNELDGNGEGIFDGDTGSVTYTQGSTIQVVSNSLSNELLAGLDNETSTGTPSAVSNWWGNISGPYSLTLNPYGTGSALSNAVAFIPWLGSGTNTQTNLIGFYPAGTPLEYPPVQLVYVTQPGGTNLNDPLSPQPVVTIEDTNGNVTPWANPIISAALTNDTTGALLSGTTNATSSNAVATFANLTVTNAGGSNLELVVSAPYLASAISTPFNITNPVPTIASVSPYYALAGSSNFTLVVTGSNFVPDSVVYWNSNALVTTFVNSTELTAIVPSSLTAQTNDVTITVVSPGPGGGPTPTSIPFDVDVDQPPIVYVDHNYTGLSSNTMVDWPYTTNSGPHIIGYDAFATVQGGVSAVASNGLVYVAAGIYVEDVVISNALHLLGPNATNNPNSGVRVPEAILEPATVGADVNVGEDEIIVYVATNHVQIKGFTVDGYNPGLDGDVVVNGKNVAAAEGIASYEGVSAIVVANNIVQDLTYDGIDFYNYNNNGVPTTGNYLSDNLIKDLGAEGYGAGILIYNNFYASVDNNVMSNVVAGVQTGNFNLPNPGTTQSINNNQVQAIAVGIFFNLMYEGCSTFTVSNNTVGFVYSTNNPEELDGFLIGTIASAVNVNFVNNLITAVPTNVQPGCITVGYNVWNTPTTGRVLITGGSVRGADYGIWVNNYDGYDTPAGLGNATVAGVTISGASVAGIYVQNDPQAASGALVQATIVSNTVVTNSALGIWVQGANSAASVLNNAASITGNHVGVWVDTGSALLENNNLTNNSIAGLYVTNNAVVDAGDCSGGNSTGLGTGSGPNGSSAGLNNLSGYSFSNAVPYSIENLNTSSVPPVLAENDFFGAGPGTNIQNSFYNPSGTILYGQSNENLAAPTNVMVSCVSEVPAGATNLPELVAQGGYYSGNVAVVAFSDNTNFTGSGTITRTYTVLDACSNLSLSAQTIIVSDTNAPVISGIPSNIVVQTGPGNTNCGQNANWTPPSASDNCAVASFTSNHHPGDLFPVGTNTVTYTAVDTSGNSSSASFTVTVVDTTAPVILSCAPNETITADTNAEAKLPDLTGNLAATNSCGTRLTITQAPIAGTEVGLGSNTVVLTVTDVYGNSNTCVAVVVVQDKTAPSLACAPDITITTLQAKDPRTTGYPTASDAGGPVTLTYNDDASGLTNCDGTGLLLRTWTATDPSSNSDSCLQTITVIDTNAPFFVFTSTNITTTNDFSYCYATVSYPAAKALDLGYFEGFEETNFVSDTNDLAYDWNDYPSHVQRVPSGSNGIPASQGQAYAIIDSTVPGVSPDDTGAYTLLGGGDAPFGLGFRTSQDVYINLKDPALAGATATNGYAFDLDTASLELGGGYGRDYIFHVAAYSSNGVVVAASNESSDDGTQRPNDLLSYPVSSTLTNTGWYTFEWFFRATNGVLAVDLKVRDTNHNVLFSETLADPSDIATNFSSNPNYLWFTFIDAAQLPIDNTTFERVVPVVPSQASASEFNVGTTIVTNIAADACGNTATNTFFITVNDVQPPSANVPTNIVQTNDSTSCGAIVNFTLPAQTDNCAVASDIATPPSGSYFPVGSNLVTVVVTDIHGNSATNTFTVTIIDTEAPSANVPANITQANDPGVCGAVVYYSIPAQTDNCGVASSNAIPASGSYFAVGTNVVTLVVTDIHGNTATNTFTVTVQDTQAPVIGALTNIVQGVDSGKNYATVTYTPTAIDNCGIASVISTPACGTQFNVGTNTVVVVATDIHGNSSTNSFTVAVIALPTIVTQPASRTNNAGTTATFTVVATSPDPLTYQWLKNGAALTNAGNVSGATNTTLSLANVQDTDAANYSVIVSDRAGSVLSSNALLTVIDAPVITLQPVSLTNAATTTATFTVGVSGTAPFTYQWYEDGTNLLTDGTNISGSTNATLTLSNVLAANDGQYSVVISNPAGSVTSSNATLVVLDPYITAEPVGVTNSLGSPVSFSITAVGTQPLSYQWQQGGIDVVSDTNHMGVNSNIFTIPSIQDSDAGSYSVLVSNSAGETNSISVNLVITHPPVIVSQPASLVVDLGQTASFSVSANGRTPFTYQWQQNGANLANGANISGATGKKLTILSASPTNAGTYVVIVSNADGTTNSIPATLTVITGPGIVSQPVSVTTNAGATVMFSVTVTGSAASYQWYMNATNLITNSAYVSGATSNILTISNVLGTNDGTYSVTVSNAAGILVSSNATLTVIDPIITSEPSSVVVNLGQSATFTVTAYGTAPQYQWLFNGATISGATSNVYTIASVTDSNAGSYTVVVSNQYSSVTSAPAATLTVIDPPTITSQPVSQTNNAGTTATFSVSVSGTPPFSYQWFKNGVFISGATNSVLILTNVQDSDVATYTVSVSNSVTNVTSSGATLTVIDPPIITSEPISLTNNAGTTATFSVAASGTSPSYQWFKNNVALTNGGNVAGATSTTLTLSSVQDSDAASYTVTVTNAAGSQTSSIVTLTVIDAATITTEPASRTNNAGTTATFTVVADGTAPKYQWYKNSILLVNGGNVAGATNATLTLTNVQDSDAASYTVSVTNAAGGQVSTPATLTVIDGPIITSEPISLTNNAGTTAIFSVTASGTSPSYQWFKNNVALTNVGNVAGATSASLTLTNVQDSDAASYTVTVTNAAGSQTSSIVTLTVIDAATITTEPASRTNNAGTTATFTVVAGGTSPSYQWYKNSTLLVNGGNVAGATNATLTLTNVQDSDAASYTVSVTNAAGGQVSTPATLTVIDGPIITSEPISLTNNAGTTATFSVAASGTAPSYQWFKNSIALTNGGNVSGVTNATLTLTNVQDSDAASYTVTVTNAAGSQTSSIVTLTVIDAATITTEPASRTNNAGTTATFTVVAGGTAPKYQWYKNSTPLVNGGNVSGATNATLALSNVQDSDAASYTVSVTNAAGGQTSTPATLTVIDGPIITSQPVSLTNIATTTATFSVTVTGTSPSFQWIKNGTNVLINSNNISGATNATLTLTNVLAADDGTYEVIVSNAAGTVTSTNATLMVIDPAILTQPQGSTNIDGSTVTFTVVAVGTQPLSYQWMQDGEDVDEATNSSLTITNIADSDAGDYTVLVSNPVGSVLSAGAELVTVPPLIVTQPVSQYALVGQTVQFSVGVNGALPFSYQWLDNSNQVAGATNRSFTITNAQTSNSGNYQVVVTNPDGSETSQIAVLGVYTSAASSLTMVNYTNNTATVLLTGVPGFRYAIQGSSNFVQWTPLITNTAPVTLVDTNSASFRFYRGVYLP